MTLSTIRDLLQPMNSPKSVAIRGEALAELQRLSRELYLKYRGTPPDADDTDDDDTVVYYDPCYC